MNKTYTIRTIADIAQIPDDRLADFFAEIAQSFALLREEQRLIQAVAQEGGSSATFTSEEFVWTDDGARNTQNVFRTEEGGPSFTINATKENANE